VISGAPLFWSTDHRSLDVVEEKLDLLCVREENILGYYVLASNNKAKY